MRELTWTCMVCGKTRPDARISVHKIDRSEEWDMQPGAFVVNVRYCNDDPACEKAAPNHQMGRKT